MQEIVSAGQEAFFYLVVHNNTKTERNEEGCIINVSWERDSKKSNYTKAKKKSNEGGWSSEGVELYFSLIAAVRKDRKDAGKEMDQFDFNHDINEAAKGRDTKVQVDQLIVDNHEDYDIPDDESVEL